jgi:hypothetical protein
VTVLAIGYPADELRTSFAHLRVVDRIDNGLDLDNDEQGRQLWLCTGPTASWPQLWPQLRNLG